MPQRTAGLKKSVGSASLSLRVLVASIFTIAALICGGTGIAIGRHSPAATVIAAILLEPFAIIGLLAAAFVIVPHSRYGDWLDAFVPRLEDWTVAAIVTAILISIGCAIVLSPRLMIFAQ